MLLDLDLLRTFRAIALSGSFTGAAQALHKSQSAVSMQIKRLESQVGNQLLLRNNQRVELTTEGEMLLSYAHRMLALNAEATAELQSPTLSGKVRLGAPVDYSSRFLSTVLPEMARTFPGVELEIHADFSEELHKMLEAGKLDLAVATTGRGRLPGEPLWSEPYHWVGAKGGSAYTQNPVPLALPPKNSFCHDLIINAINTTGRSYRTAFIAKTDFETVIALSADFAVGMVTEAILQSYPLSGFSVGLQPLTQQDGFPPVPPLEACLVRAPGEVSPAAEQLATMIINFARLHFPSQSTP